MLLGVWVWDEFVVGWVLLVWSRFGSGGGGKGGVFSFPRGAQPRGPTPGRGEVGKGIIKTKENTTM